MHVSVIGGGISGASIASALTNCPNLTVNVYEGGAAIREMGAAIGFGINAQTALKMIDPILFKALFDAGGNASDGYMRHLVGQGPDAGQWIRDIATEYPPVAHVPRAAFLGNMWKTIPESVLRLNKKLKKVKRVGQRYKIHFEDDTSVDTDAVIGTDGIHSTVRRLILEGSHPDAVEPVWAGFWDAQRLVPIDQAWQTLRTKESYQNPADVRTNCLAGDPGFLLLSQIAPAQLAVCVACGRADPNGPLKGQRSVSLSKEFLEPYLSGFGDLGKSMMTLLLDEEDPKAYFEWESAKAPFYNKDQLCIMGDAAHASTPWMGSGAAMAIEDAMLLGKLLREIEDPAQIADAFDIYSQVRLERTQRVVRASRKNGQLMCGASGLDITVMKREDADMGNMDWVYGFDLDAHVDSALALLKERKKTA